MLDPLASTAIQETKKCGGIHHPGLGRLFRAQRVARIGYTPHEIERLGYQFWINGSGPPVRDVHDWRHTEEQLKLRKILYKVKETFAYSDQALPTTGVKSIPKSGDGSNSAFAMPMSDCKSLCFSRLTPNTLAAHTQKMVPPIEKYSAKNQFTFCQARP